MDVDGEKDSRLIRNIGLGETRFKLFKEKQIRRKKLQVKRPLYCGVLSVGRGVAGSRVSHDVVGLSPFVELCPSSKAVNAIFLFPFSSF